MPTNLTLEAVCLCKDSILKKAVPAPTVFLHFLTNEVWKDPKALQLLKSYDNDNIKTFILDIDSAIKFQQAVNSTHRAIESLVRDSRELQQSGNLFKRIRHHLVDLPQASWLPEGILENLATLKKHLEDWSRQGAAAPVVADRALDEFAQYLAYTQRKPIKKFIQHDTDAVAFGDLWRVWEIIPEENRGQPFFSTNFSEFCNNISTSLKAAFDLLDYRGHDEYKNLPVLDEALKQNMLKLLEASSVQNYKENRWLYPVSAGFLAINCEPFHKILETCSSYLTKEFPRHYDEEDFLGQIHYTWIRLTGVPIFTLPYAYNSRPNAPLCAQLVLDCYNTAQEKSTPKEAPSPESLDPLAKVLQTSPSQDVPRKEWLLNKDFSPDLDQLCEKGEDFIEIIEHNPQLEGELQELSRGNIIFLHPDSMSKIYSPWPAVDHLSKGILPSQFVVEQYDNFAGMWRDCINGLILRNRVIALDYVNRCVKRVNESLQEFQAEWAKALSDLKAKDERATQENGGQKTTSRQDRFLRLFPKPRDCAAIDVLIINP